MWTLKIFWNDGVKTKEYYDTFERTAQAIDYYIRLVGLDKINHFKIKYRGDQNE